MADNSRVLARDGDKGDLARFFATWVRHPIAMGAVASARAWPWGGHPRAFGKGRRSGSDHLDRI